MRNDYRGKAVVITGGTKGIGLAIGLSFAREGAQVYLTHRWGSATEQDVLAQFAALPNAPTPYIVEADVKEDSETEALLDLVAQKHDHVEAFISNVCIVQPAQGVESYRKRSLLTSIEYSSWPMVAYPQQMKKKFGRYPRYIVGISSDGPDHYFANYEFVAASKAVMETFCRYMAKHLGPEGVIVNVLRTRNVLTQAVYEIFGSAYTDFIGKYAGEEYFMQPEEVGDAVLAMCSGMMDAMSGQVIMVDKGISFADTLMYLLERREQLGL